MRKTLTLTVGYSQLYGALYLKRGKNGFICFEGFKKMFCLNLNWEPKVGDKINLIISDKPFAPDNIIIATNNRRVFIDGKYSSNITRHLADYIQTLGSGQQYFCVSVRTIKAKPVDMAAG